MEGKGIKDLMERQRYKPQHLQKQLIEKGAYGNWSGRSGIQNVYNLIDGKVMPRDGYILIIISEMLNYNLREILLRYSSHESVKTNNERDVIDW